MSLSRLKEYALYRLPLLIVLVLLGLWVWTAIRAPAELGRGALEARGESGWRSRAAELIARVHGVWVTPESVSFLPINEPPAWYESVDYLPLTFLAVPDRALVQLPVESNLPDVFYVELAMTPDGVPIDSRRFTNLTRTPAAREAVLGRSGSVLALAIEIFGQVEAVQLLDFSGDRAEPAVRAGTAPVLVSAMRWLDNLQRTGRWEGVQATEYSLTVPVDRVESELAGERLALRFYLREGRVGEAVISMPTGELLEGEAFLRRQPARGATLTDPGSWAANWLRDQDWVGAQRMAVLEQVVFGLRDQVRRRLYDWFGFTGAPPIEILARPATAAAPVIVTRPSGDAEWPPPRLEQTGHFDEAIEAEGEWVVAEPSWLRRTPNATPAFLQTFLRTDPERPYGWVLVVAMDLRQLELAYQQGTVHPRATTGRRGTGQIPRDGDTMGRLVAAFNGGFKTTHGAFGSVVDRVVYLEPMPRRATVAWTDDSDAILFGTWGDTSAIPENVRSLRQNLRPMVADGEINPAGGWRWFAGNDLDPVTERSAICFRGEHTLMYFWSAEARYDAIGRAMLSADCEYGIPLDMNPHQTGWEFYRVDDFANGEWESARPVESMAFRHERYLESVETDFFYLLLRETFDRTLPAIGDRAWSGAGMPTTEDGFLPVAAHLRTDGEAVRLVALDEALLHATFALGPAEPPPVVAAAYQPRAPLAITDPVVRVSFDAADAESPRGLTVDGWSYFPTRGTGLWLVVDRDRIEIVEAMVPAAPTRIELLPLESLESYGGVCSAVALLSEPESVVFAWGNVPDTRRRLQELGVSRAGVLGCGRHVAAVEVLQPLDSGWSATDVFTDRTRMIETLAGERSHLFFEVGARGPRQRRMFMNEASELVFERPDRDYERRGP